MKRSKANTSRLTYSVQGNLSSNQNATDMDCCEHTAKRREQSERSEKLGGVDYSVFGEEVGGALAGTKQSMFTASFSKTRLSQQV